MKTAIQIAICDDDQEIGKWMTEILSKYIQTHGLYAELKVFETGKMLIDYLNLENRIDVLYLDIELEDMTGVAIGSYIRRDLQDYAMEIIYVSGADGYDRQLFDVQPLHFIPKPIDPALVVADLELGLDRVQKRFVYFRYAKGKETHAILLRDIIYFEGHNREVKIVYTGGEVCFYGKLSEVMLQLKAYSFLVVHKSYIINTAHVLCFRWKEVELSDGSIIPISRGNREKIRNIQLTYEGT